jgi:predicted component of type VI protein secretion system
MVAVEELSWQKHESVSGRYAELPQIVLNVPKVSPLTKIEVRSKGKFLSEHLFGAGRAIAGRSPDKGRSPDNEIHIKSKFVSRRHAQITSNSFGCTIEDLNSTNGILVGNKRVKRHRLRDGDVVVLGIHELVYTDLRETDQIVEEKSAVGGK